ncbi:uncharacterized protein LOC123291364, partial [Chrysoperla carnea]|uniref:uncharacterized protein LOC123291364 n=1 Tax=Chrysoperla carnea TaxID=189513 RepID=UPI001D067FC0
INFLPYLGVLSQELNSQIYRLCTLATYKSYIAASYVKYIESAGARVVPIKIGQPDSYYEEIVNSVNGILLPGDNALLNETHGYGEAAHKIYKLIINKNKNNQQPIPLFGICLGFQAIIYNALKQQDIRTRCHISGISLPLIFQYDYTKSRLFKTAPYEIINILKSQSVTANSHSYCITSKDAIKYKLNKKWLILSTNKIRNLLYISSIESKHYPIWGIQFHPEKTMFEWSKEHYDHTIHGILVSQYLMNFFVNECPIKRKAQIAQHINELHQHGHGEWPPFMGPHNSRPIIGILSQEISPPLVNCVPFYLSISKYKSYISASYVKYIEMAGARVVPIRIGQSTQYYQLMASSLNGVVFPGGAAMLTANDGYADVAKIFYSYAINQNLPIWGTCLGFEIILVLSAGTDLRTRCNVINSITRPLRLRKEYKASRIFKLMPLNILNIVQKQSVMTYMHSHCVTMKNFTHHNMTKDWFILTTSTTPNNLTFISTIESKKYPIWGVQYHPEKALFDWTHTSIVHTFNAIKVSQYLMNFFVNECRKNHNRFPSMKKEQSALIYNYKSMYIGKFGCKIEQCYFLN